MKTRHKILIDRVVGLPLVFVLNGAAKVLGALLRRDHRDDPSTVRRIVVAKFVGMGSILQATAMMEGLKERFPNATLVFVTSKSNRPLMDRLEAIDRTIYIDESGLVRLAVSSLRAAFELIRQRVDLYFDLEVYSAYAALICTLSLARNRYGFYRTSAEFKNGLHTHLMYFNTRRPVRQIYHQLGRMAGIAPWEGRQVSRLCVRDADMQGVATQFPDLKPGYVVVNPNASDLLLERRWPLERFAELIGKLVTAGSHVVLVGSPGEKAWVARLEGMLSTEARPGVTNTAGRLRLNELFALLAQAGLRCNE